MTIYEWTRKTVTPATAVSRERHSFASVTLYLRTCLGLAVVWGPNDDHVFSRAAQKAARAREGAGDVGRYDLFEFIVGPFHLSISRGVDPK